MICNMQWCYVMQMLYYNSVEITDINAVIENIDINVVIAMEDDNNSVSRPIFSA